MAIERVAEAEWAKGPHPPIKIGTLIENTPIHLEGPRAQSYLAFDPSDATLGSWVRGLGLEPL